MADASNRAVVIGLQEYLLSVIKAYLNERRKYVFGAASVLGCPAISCDTDGLMEMVTAINM